MKKYIIIVLIVILFAQCTSIYISLITPKNVVKSLKVMERGTETVVYLPMVHLAKPIFFDKVKIVIDSLKKVGYTVYFEQISINRNQQKDTLDINIRKLRKIIGANIVGGYDKKTNNSLPNSFKSKKYISQNNSKLGLDSMDVIADVTLKELIKAHEDKNGNIILTNYDLNTGLNENYKSKKINGYYAIHNFRDSIASNIILKKKRQKSLIIYGKSHWYGIWPYFRDEGYILKQ